MERVTAELYYGWQDTEEGTYHAFMLEDPKDRTDADDAADELAALLDTVPEDERFNWNVMDVQIPDGVVQRIQSDAIRALVCNQEDARQEENPADADYELHLVGSDITDVITVHGWEAAVALLTEKYNETVSQHGNGWRFDEQTLDSESGEFTITGEEFFQSGYIVTVNTKSGLLHTIEEIRRRANEASVYAQEYQYRLEDMQGVYDELYSIKELADKLETELAKVQRGEV